MWNIRLLTSKVDPELASSVKDLLESTTRTMIWGISTLLFGCVLATAIWPEQIAINVWIAVPLMLLNSFLALKILTRNYLVAHAIWQFSLIGGITALVYLFQRPEIAFFYALLPLISVITLQRFSGLIMESVIGLAVFWMYHGLLYQAPPPVFGLVILVGGFVSAILGWVSFNSLLTVTEWSIYSNRQAQQNLSEAREHRAQLVKVAKELDQANIRLERAINMLVLARNEAEEAKDARNRFALAISHELRSPLNFIIGFSELMVNKPSIYAPREKWPPGLYEDILQIYTSSKHLMNLVNDVLDLGQIENLQMALLKEWIDPAEIVQEVEKMVQPAFIRKHLSFEKEIEPGLPIVYADQTRIRQVLLNLISNSLRFTEHGGVKVSVKMGKQNMILFCVQDSGRGIDPDELPHIFEPFHQVGQESWRRKEGAGLGVPISRKFVELHGGQMWVESQLGKGTRFYFTLPALGTRDTYAVLKAQEEVDRYYWNQLGKHAEQESLVLVLSRDPSAAEVLAPYIEGFKLVSSTEPQQVVSQVREFLPRAILVDKFISNDPDLWEIFLQQLSQLPYDLPVICFTFPGNPTRPRDLPEVIVDYLVKPVYFENLLQSFKKLPHPVKEILVVDDDPAMVQLIERSASQPQPQEEIPGGISYQIFSAQNGSEAIEKLRHHRPDVVLLDLALPDINGWEVIERTKDFHVPTILVTAHDWPQVISKDGQEVLRVLMHRPLARHELSEALKSLLSQLRPRYPANLDALKPAEDPAG